MSIYPGRARPGPRQGTFDCLVRSFFFTTRFRYEIATSYFAVGNV